MILDGSKESLIYLHIDLLDSIHLKSAAAIPVIFYTVSNGSQSLSGSAIAIGDPIANLRTVAGAIPDPAVSGALSLRVRLLTWTGHLIADDTFTFGAGANFGADETVHVRDRSAYRLTFSIARRP